MNPARSPTQDTTPDGRFVLVSRIAERGLTTVHRARDLETGETVAVKLCREPARADRLAFEGHVLRLASHPNIVRFVASGRLDDTAWLAMEHFAGVPLTSIVRPGGQPAERVARLARQAAEALAALHGLGLVHGDVAPAHQLISLRPERADELRLVGFGAVRKVGARVAEERATPLYLSPEQASGVPVDARSDVYGLGCVLYELLSGRYPLPGVDPSGWATAEDALRAHRETLPTPLAEVAPSVPAPLAALVMAMLSKSADLRPSALDLVEAFAAPASTPPPAERPRRPRQTLLQTGLNRVESSSAPPEDPAGPTEEVRRPTLRGLPRQPEEDQRPTLPDLTPIPAEAAAEPRPTLLDGTPDGFEFAPPEAPPPSVIVDAALAAAPTQPPRPRPAPAVARPAATTVVTAPLPRRADLEDVETVEQWSPARSRAGRWIGWSLALAVVGGVGAAVVLHQLAERKAAPAAQAVPPPAAEPERPNTQRVTYTIASVPPGAAVLHEGVQIGTTPLSWPWPFGRELVVTLRLSGYEDRILRFNGTSDGASQVAALQKAGGERDRIRLETEPPGVAVYEAGQLVGTTPFEWRPEARGVPVEIELRREGYATLVYPVLPEPSEVARTLRVPLVPLRAPRVGDTAVATAADEPRVVREVEPAPPAAPQPPRRAPRVKAPPPPPVQAPPPPPAPRVERYQRL